MIDQEYLQITILQALYRVWSQGREIMSLKQLGKEVKISPNELIALTGSLERLRRSGYASIGPTATSITPAGLDFFESYDLGLQALVEHNLSLECDILSCLLEEAKGLPEDQLPHCRERIYRVSLRPRLLGRYIARVEENRIILLLAGRERLRDLTYILSEFAIHKSS